MRYIAVIDGEHYPPVVEAALGEVQEAGDSVVAAVMAGGQEKLSGGDLTDLGGIAVRAGPDPRAVLSASIAELGPDAVLDLSDEPVLDYRRRHELAGVALWHGVPYAGADFRFTPPRLERLAGKPSIAVVGTGKRTGKTAVTGFMARTLAREGRAPIVVAMGRGGPAQPEVLRGDRLELEPSDLLAMVDEGKHAASDYVEDALLGRVPTVGCRRCGGGLAGGVEFTNVAAGVRLANDLDGDLLLLEGSGSAIPPVRAEVTGLVVPASIPPEYLAGYMGPYRLLLSDFVVVTMCEEPFASTSHISEITSLIADSFRGSGVDHGAREEIKVVRTVFRPTPTRSVEGSRVFVATTAPQPAGASIRRHLEREHGCRVTGISHSLSDRKKLQEELKTTARHSDVLLCEIKAAGIDVATRRALDEGLDVVYMDNVPFGIEDDDLVALIHLAGDRATERFRGGR
jgi:cyclic 2,3-diphosphoglycerate synthase